MAEVAGQMRVNEDGGNGKMKLDTGTTGLNQLSMPAVDENGLMMIDVVASGAGLMKLQVNLGS